MRDPGLAQKKAWDNRHKIRLGDRFLWHFSGGYGTSGKLRQRYMKTSECYQGDMALTVCRIYEGANGYGSFVDYCLSLDGLWHGDFTDCIRINGPDAFKMERIKEAEP